MTVQGNFTTGSAQNNALSTDYNLRIYDIMTWTRGRHFVKFGAGIPHLNRRAFDDNTNALGTYVFGPTLAADGVTVLTSALDNYESGHPSGYSQNSGQVHFVYHQQELGALHPGPVKDQRPVLDHARHPLRLAEFLRRRSGWASRRACRSPGCSNEASKDSGARRRRHLLRPHRLRFPA